MNHTWPLDEEQSTVPIAESNALISFHQASPSRFTNATTITFDLLRQCHVSLDIYDGTGRVIQTLIDSDLNPGLHSTAFEGSSLPSGVYFYSIRSGEENGTGKLLLLR